jgi:hypothetical protein
MAAKELYGLRSSVVHGDSVGNARRRGVRSADARIDLQPNLCEASGPSRASGSAEARAPSFNHFHSLHHGRFTVMLISGVYRIVPGAEADWIALGPA